MAECIRLFHSADRALFVSLFALLAGVSSAQGEREEWQLLFTQPVPRTAYVPGKFCALFSIWGAVLLLLFLPALVSGSAPRGLVGVDLIALFAAHWPIFQSVPDLWVAALMLNPLDAFRIEALFALQQIPAEAANKTARRTGGSNMPPRGLR